MTDQITTSRCTLLCRLAMRTLACLTERFPRAARLTPERTHHIDYWLVHPEEASAIETHHSRSGRGLVSTPPPHSLILSANEPWAGTASWIARGLCSSWCVVWVVATLSRKCQHFGPERTALRVWRKHARDWCLTQDGLLHPMSSEDRRARYQRILLRYVQYVQYIYTSSRPGKHKHNADLIC